MNIDFHDPMTIYLSCVIINLIAAKTIFYLDHTAKDNLNPFLVSGNSLSCNQYDGYVYASHGYSGHGNSFHYFLDPRS